MFTHHVRPRGRAFEHALRGDLVTRRTPFRDLLNGAGGMARAEIETCLGRPDDRRCGAGVAAEAMRNAA